MTAATPPAWSIFKQIFADHWDGFKRVYPRYNRRYYDDLVATNSATTSFTLVRS